MRTKDFIYYASAAVLLAVTTQVAQADEVATQTPSITKETTINLRLQQKFLVVKRHLLKHQAQLFQPLSL